MNQQLINELREIEAMAHVLGEKAAKMRAKLEKDSKPKRNRKNQKSDQLLAALTAKFDSQFKSNF